jgi:hypothetical protein
VNWSQFLFDTTANGSVLTEGGEYKYGTTFQYVDFLYGCGNGQNAIVLSGKNALYISDSTFTAMDPSVHLISTTYSLIARSIQSDTLFVTMDTSAVSEAQLYLYDSFMSGTCSVQVTGNLVDIVAERNIEPQICTYISDGRLVILHNTLSLNLLYTKSKSVVPQEGMRVVYNNTMTSFALTDDSVSNIDHLYT